MVLSDRTIARLIAEGRIGIDPYDESLLQPSSVDVRVDRYFRVFHNARYPFIDVKEPQEELTEQVEIDGDRPFILHPGEFVLGSTLERVTLPDDLVARLEGKALAVDTPVPTPRGWTAMGDLEVGDLVYTPEGLPTVVVDATEELVGRPCREVVFSDRTSIVCDAAHQWVTRDKRARSRGEPESIVTTDEIAATLRAGADWNHHVRLSLPVEYPERDLPIDPYVLGAWIGDGTTTAAEITTADPEIPHQIEFAGYAVKPKSAPIRYAIGGVGRTRDARTGRYTRNDSLSTLLRDVRGLGGKRIPDEYLTSSLGQRSALLEGIMDTDGYVDRFGRCELTTVKRDLAFQYHELIASLGFRPVIHEDRARLNGVDRGPRYRVRFTPDRPVVRLKHKLDRQKLNGASHRFRAIVDVRTIRSERVRCIEVSSPAGAFLVGPSYIPTHNSSLGRLGLLIHSTAGFIDPGWDGHVTLELSNVANLPITIYHGMKIGQVSFMQLSEPTSTPYGSSSLGSKYQGQRGPTPSRYWQNFES
jgi:deoxycytidine triphosphate deaminase